MPGNELRDHSPIKRDPDKKINHRRVLLKYFYCFQTT